MENHFLKKGQFTCKVICLWKWYKTC